MLGTVVSSPAPPEKTPSIWLQVFFDQQKKKVQKDEHCLLESKFSLWHSLFSSTSKCKVPTTSFSPFSEPKSWVLFQNQQIESTAMGRLRRSNGHLLLSALPWFLWASAVRVRDLRTFRRLRPASGLIWGETPIGQFVLSKIMKTKKIHRKHLSLCFRWTTFHQKPWFMALAPKRSWWRLLKGWMPDRRTASISSLRQVLEKCLTELPKIPLLEDDYPSQEVSPQLMFACKQIAPWGQKTKIKQKLLLAVKQTPPERLRSCACGRVALPQLVRLQSSQKREHAECLNHLNHPSNVDRQQVPAWKHIFIFVQFGDLYVILDYHVSSILINKHSTKFQILSFVVVEIDQMVVLHIVRAWMY